MAGLGYFCAGEKMTPLSQRQNGSIQGKEHTVPASFKTVPRSRLILISDDSSDDLLLLRLSFEKAGVLNPVREVRSGEETIAYLKGEGQYADRVLHPFPGILLLDLHMPKGDGFKVLSWIRDKLPVSGLLIIVLSGVKEIKDVNRAYALGASSFLT